MKTRFIDVEGYWGIIVVCDYDRNDKVELEGIMDSFGMSRPSIRKAMDILSHYNTGMTVSRDDVRMSAIFISKSTSPSEFYSTAIHEIRHTADAIINYYGADWGEDAAYTTGYITKMFVEEVGEPCNM